MNLTPPKLKPLHVGIIAAVLALIIGAALANFWIKPIYDENKGLEATVAQLQNDGSDARLEAAQADVKKAATDKFYTLQGWNVQRGRYFLVGPNRRTIDLSHPFETLTSTVAMEHRRSLIPVLESWGRRKGLVISGLSLGPAPNNPNVLKNYETQPYRLDFRGLKVTGSFNQVLDLLASTETIPRLVLINNVALTAAQSGEGGDDITAVVRRATGNTVTADLDISVFIFTEGKFEADPRFPAAAQDAGAGGGGMGGPPMPGGGPPMPGGPPVGGPPMPGAPPPV